MTVSLFEVTRCLSFTREIKTLADQYDERLNVVYAGTLTCGVAYAQKQQDSSSAINSCAGVKPAFHTAITGS